ncbi:MAG: single-stranded DNA-binding protein, partial [Roseiflexus sp.]|nr:single-stranded DNA-binding protein [Roseiflexus sp.]
RVYIEGRLQTRSWEDRNTGEKRYMTEVVAQDMIILTPKGDRVPTVEVDDLEAQAVGSVARRAPAPVATSEAPSNGPARAGALRTPGRNMPQPVESEDDLPF